MDMWSILVMGVVKQGLGCDFDRLHELVNEHKTLRNFLGHTDWDKKLYQYQTLVDNVSLLNPELLGKVNQLIVERGHTVVGKKPGEPLRGRCDSFVVETNVHYPTDVNLLLDATRCMHRYAGPLGSKHKVLKWRQWQKLQNTLIDKFNKIRKIRRASRKDIKAYLKFCAKLVGRAQALIVELTAKGVPPQETNKIKHFCTLCGRSTRSTGVFSRARQSHRTKRYSPSLSTRGGSRKARQVPGGTRCSGLHYGRSVPIHTASRNYVDRQ